MMGLRLRNEKQGEMFLLLLFVCMIISSTCHMEHEEPNFYSYTVNNIGGEPVDLAAYKGKVSLVVNVASECGYTDGHYTGMDLLQTTFAHTGRFNVLAFPCNQFGQQEPGSNKEISEFVRRRTKSNFPLFAKINVIHTTVDPAWQYLIESSGRSPSWNFYKYLIDHTGHVINVWGPDTDVEDLRSSVQQAILDIGQHVTRDEF